MQERHDEPLWYIRRREEVRGPLPSSQLSKLLLVGRLRDSDEVSRDRESWTRVADFMALIPQVMHEVGSAGERERLLTAIVAEEEGKGHAKKRRRAPLKLSGEPPPESAEETRMRTRREQLHTLIEEERKAEGGVGRALASGALILALLVALALALSYPFLLTPAPPPPKEADCNAPPGREVVWEACRLSGVNAAGADLSGSVLRSAVLLGGRFARATLNEADLSYADLTGADLRSVTARRAKLVGTTLQRAVLSNADLGGADLSFADLRGARLDGADLAGALLEKAIWINGAVCGAGSIGSCKLPP